MARKRYKGASYWSDEKAIGGRDKDPAGHFFDHSVGPNVGLNFQS